MWRKVEEAVDVVGIKRELSTGPVRLRPVLSVSRFLTNNFSALDWRSFSVVCKINRQIHNSYYYCYSFLEI